MPRKFGLSYQQRRREKAAEADEEEAGEEGKRKTHSPSERFFAVWVETKIALVLTYATVS